MKSKLKALVAKRRCFEYDDYEFEEKLGPRELRPMTSLDNGRILYEGEWLRDTDIPQGRGVALYFNFKEIPDTFYEGYWLNGKRNGKARTINIKKLSYEGQMKDNLRSGHGVWTRTEYKYTGQWANDLFNGQGETIS